jgi:hypothetical protein
MERYGEDTSHAALSACRETTKEAMPFDPNFPSNNSPLAATGIRDQFNGLKTLIDAVPAGPPGPPGPAGGGLASVSEDTAPTLGGPLRVNGQPIVGDQSDLVIRGGDNETNTPMADGGDIHIMGGSANTAGREAGLVSITGGNGGTTGGSVYIAGGVNASESAVGPVEIAGIVLMLPNLPTEDPHVANQLWNDAGTLKISAG